VTYSWITKSEIRNQVAARLKDPDFIYWSSSEIDSYIAETLRTWGLLTGYWKERIRFVTTAATLFYDLFTKAPLIFLRTLKDQDLVLQLQYHLCENPRLDEWDGTEMFVLDDLTQALQRRRNQLLVETGCVLTSSIVTGISPPDGRVDLADTVIDVRRVAWKNSAGVYTNLWSNDEFSADSYIPDWNLAPGLPVTFSMALTPRTQLQLIPPPIAVGELLLVSVSCGANFDPTSGVLLGIPDDLSCFLKWGALADLLSKESQAYDPGRAAYCETRWQEGIKIAKMMPSVLKATINAQQVPIESIADVDAYYPNWHNEPGAPKAIALMGFNLVACAPLANAGPYSISLDVTRQAPIPATDADYVQIAREEIDGLIGYAEHIAYFKKGAFELQNSMAGYQNFMAMAALHNSRLSALAPNIKTLLEASTKEEKSRPRIKEEEESSVG
jgi:hypothetical protein